MRPTFSYAVATCLLLALNACGASKSYQYATPQPTYAARQTNAKGYGGGYGGGYQPQVQQQSYSVPGSYGGDATKSVQSVPGVAASPPAPPGDSYAKKEVAETSTTSSDKVAYADEDVTVSGSGGASGTGSVGGPPPIVPAATGVSANATGTTAQEMWDIEARVTIEVEKVSAAAIALRALVKKHGGNFTSDMTNDDVNSTGGSFVIRIPSQASEAFLGELTGVGAVRSRQITARDIGKEYYDAGIYLGNLEAALRRYEEILAKAKDVNEILRIEAELTRVRSQIDRVKGDMRWMKDRASRSTVYISIYSPRPETDQVFNPTAKLYPGLRFTYLADFRGEEKGGNYIGGGLSLQFARAFSIDLDGLRSSSAKSSGLDLFLATLGGEFYSDFLGAGKRKWLNPYMGFRAGYARFLSKNEAVAGITFGIELFKTKYVMIDSQLRTYAFFGSSAGAHVGLQPTLGVNIAF